MLLELSRSSGAHTWAAAVLALLTGTLWTASYYRLTSLVLDKAGKAGKDRV